MRVALQALTPDDLERVSGGWTQDRPCDFGSRLDPNRPLPPLDVQRRQNAICDKAIRDGQQRYVQEKRDRAGEDAIRGMRR